jgi:hypothetical protein
MHPSTHIWMPVVGAWAPRTWHTKSVATSKAKVTIKSITGIINKAHHMTVKEQVPFFASLSVSPN